tara:strand:- start:290 stop:568 length:279 start_codon:yes stop_codon:yes gene_type:complete
MIKYMRELEEDDEDILYESMVNSYMIITDQLSFDELLEYNGCSLPFNPKKDIDNDVIDKIIDYFCTLEEYEKCGELKKLKESKKYKKNFINL